MDAVFPETDSSADGTAPAENEATAPRHSAAIPASFPQGQGASASLPAPAREGDAHPPSLSHESAAQGGTVVQPDGRISAAPRHPAMPALRRARRARRHRAAYLLMRAHHQQRRAVSRRINVVSSLCVSVLAVLLVGGIVASTVSAAAYYNSQQRAVTSMSAHIGGRDSVRVYDSKGVLLDEIDSNGAQHSVSLAHMPVVIVNATVAIEDKDFWINNGVDFQAIARAALADLSVGRISQGGSTITQQLIKQNVLNNDPTFTRKIEEATLALGLTTQGVYTKSQLLQMYLNSIPYGPVSYGIDAAATDYFGYTDNPATGESAAQHLDLAQASLLAGIPKSPSYNDPLLSSDGFAHARARQALVLGAMVQQGYISQAQANAAWAEAGQPGFFHPRSGPPDLAPHFVNYVQNQLDQMIASGQLPGVQSEAALARSGLDIHTTLDFDLQNQVQQAMLDHLCGNDVNDYPGSAYLGKRLIRQDNVTNAAAVIADHHTGAIRVLLGSMDYYGTLTCHPDVNDQFDVATQGYRGPGSSFKPIVYATAFQQGLGPASIVHNEPTRFWDPGASTWYMPHDADNNHLAANLTVRNALQLSQNIPAVETMQFAGVNNVKANAQRWGITNWQGTWGLSSAIGSLDVHLIDMVQAYTVFANYGEFIPLHAIDHITSAAGAVVYQYQQPKPVQVLDPRIAYLITSILSDNVARRPEFGPCSPMYLDADPADCGAHFGNSPNVWPAAVKTGTGDDLTNDWTMGYTMDYTMGVWVGNNNFSPMQWVDGVTGAAPIFYNSMIYAERTLPKTPFPVPAGMHPGPSSPGGTDWLLDGQKIVNLPAGPVVTAANGSRG
jgi:membrane peptidoglycan carboxypeptidase